MLYSLWGTKDANISMADGTIFWKMTTDHVFVSDSKRDRPVQLTDKEYDRLIQILSMPLSERAKDHSSDMLYRKAKRHRLRCERISDPYRDEELTRLTRNGFIVLPPREVDNCIDFYHEWSSGGGAMKLWHVIKNSYAGISKNRIVVRLSQLENHLKNNPRLGNKIPLIRPSSATKVMERHQFDLVDMNSIKGTDDGGYVLAILDCYSRFLWLRSVLDKRPETIGKKLEEIYLEFGPPQILQCDQGNEYNMEVIRLCKSYNIKIILSKPHHPESQGKVDKSHGTLRALVQKLLEHSPGEKSWSEALPLIAKNFNIGVQSSIKMSPYERLFGIKSNFIAQAYIGGLCEEVEEEEKGITGELELHTQTDANDNHTDCSDIPHKMKRRKLELDLENVRRHQVNEWRSNSQQEKTMVDRQLRKNPPSIYEIGEIVNVKYEGPDKRVRRGSLAVAEPKVCQAIIRERKDHMYTVLLISDSKHGEVLKVNVGKITSLTPQEEKERERSNQSTSLTKAKRKTTLNRLKGLETSSSQMVEGKDGMEMLLENAALHGLRLDSDNSGNGNCLFLALQQQLGTNGVKKTHQEIRQEVVQFLSKNVVIGEGRDAVYLPDFVTGYSSWEEYLDDLGQDGVWGDNIALVGAATLYQISICIVSSLHESDPVVIEPSTGTSLFDIHLGHISETHYVTLRPQKTLCELCGSVCEEHTCPHVILEESGHEKDSSVSVDAIFSDERMRIMREWLAKLEQYLSFIIPLCVAVTTKIHEDKKDLVHLAVNHLHTGVFFYLLRSVGYKTELIDIDGDLFGCVDVNLKAVFDKFREYVKAIVNPGYQLVYVTEFIRNRLQDHGCVATDHPLVLMTETEYASLTDHSPASRDSSKEDD